MMEAPDCQRNMIDMTVHDDRLGFSVGFDNNETFTVKFPSKEELERCLATMSHGTPGVMESGYWSIERFPFEKEAGHRETMRRVLKLNILDDAGQTYPIKVPASMKLHVVFSEYARLSDNPLKSIRRMQYCGKSIFPSDAKKMRLTDLGVTDKDIFTVFTSLANGSSVGPDISTSKANTGRSGVKVKASKRRSTKQRSPWAGVLEDTSSEEYYKKLHSAKMELVWKEAGPKFDAIRKKLNDMSIKRTSPKLKSKKTKRKQCAPVDCCAGSAGLGCKAGKGSFAINVGAVENLYKTSKQSKHSSLYPRFTLDLRGKTNHHALVLLNENFPSWMQTAMEGEDPYVIQVKIVCGKGSQVLSEVVEQWIKGQKQVANAPKSKL